MARLAFFSSLLNSYTSNDHVMSVTVPAGLTNAILVITKSVNDSLPWPTFLGITVNGSATGIVDSGTSGALGATGSIRTWYLLAPTSGTYNVVVSFNTSSSNAGLLGVAIYDDIDQATPIYDFKANTGGTVASPISSAAFSAASPGLVLAHGRALSAATVTPGGGGTALGGLSRPDEVVFELAVGATGASMAWTGTNPTQASIVALALKPAAASASLGGSATLGDVQASGGISSGASTLSGGATLGDVSAAGTLGAAPGVITTPPLKNNTGSLLANLSGIVLNIYNATTGVLVVRKTGLTSNGAGVVSVSDALLTPGTAYAYEPDLSAPGLGRRLPVAVAT